MTTKATRARKRQPAPQRPINQAAIDLLRSWREIDEEGAREQQETGEYLMKALDEERARIGARKLFS